MCVCVFFFEVERLRERKFASTVDVKTKRNKKTIGVSLLKGVPKGRVALPSMVPGGGGFGEVKSSLKASELVGQSEQQCSWIWPWAVVERLSSQEEILR